MRLSFHMSFVDKFSCILCCKRFDRKKQQVKAFKEAAERLDEESDIITLFKALRVAKFWFNTKLRQDQKYLVSMFQQYHVSLAAIDIKYNPDDLEPEIDDKFFNEFSPGSEDVDKIIYERIFKKDMNHYQNLDEFSAFNLMGQYLKKEVLTVKNLEDLTNQQNDGGANDQQKQLFRQLLLKKIMADVEAGEKSDDSDLENGDNQKQQDTTYSINKIED